MNIDMLLVHICEHLVCNGILNTQIDPHGIHLVNIEWQRNGQKIEDTSHYTFTNLDLIGLGFVFEQTLQVNSIRASLAGLYSCLSWIGNDKTRSMTDSTTVTVQSEL